MRITFLSILCWLLAFPLRADQTNLLIAVDGAASSNATLKTATPTAIGAQRLPPSSATSGNTSNRPGAFNTATNPFRAYDNKLIAAVQKRWYALVELHHLYPATGSVTVHFQVLVNGTVQHLEVSKNTAGKLLGLFCEKAVNESAPFDPLPPNLRALAGTQPRDINFIFYY